MGCENVWAPAWLSYFTAATSSVLTILTICGNLLVCVAVFKDPHKKLRTPFMFILVNLAVTDLLVGCLTLPMSVATHILEGLGRKTKDHVTISRMTYFISCTASILNLTAFCVDRYIAVNWPIKYRRLLNAKKCLMIFCAIWITAIVISSLYLVTDFINFLFIFAQVSFFFAIIISAVTSRLLRKLVVYSKERRTITNTKRNTKSSRKTDRRITKLFIVMLLMFFLCYTPAIVFMYVLKFCPDCPCTSRHVLRDLQFLFIVMNSAVNPYVCTIRLKPFRHALKTIFNMNKNDPSTELQQHSPTVSFRKLQKHGTEQFSVVGRKDTGERIPIVKAANEEEACNGHNNENNNNGQIKTCYN